MKKINEKGFGATGLVAVIILIAAVIGIGYMVYRQQSKADKQLSSNDNHSATSSEQPQSKEEYIVAPKSGVKLGVGPYIDKVTVVEDEAGPGDTRRIRIKPEFSEYIDCETGITITRVKELPSWFSGTNFKVGDYYYWTDLGYSTCDTSFAKKSTKPDVLTGKQLAEQFNTFGVKEL